MRSSTCSLVLLAAIFLLAAPSDAAEGPPGMTWVDGLPKAFEIAKAEGKPVMICINATKVAGRRWRPEPAAKELRENTYRNAAVIKLSEKFVCAYLTGEGTAEDFGELRARFAIDGDIISPQHIFVYPDGRLVFRKEYWPYGVGQQAVDALLKMMNDALKKVAARAQTTPPEGGTDGEPEKEGDGEEPEADAEPGNVPPDDPEGRAKWIEAQFRLVDSTDEIIRRDGLRALIDADKDGDVVTRVLELLDTQKKKTPILIDVARELGRPGLDVAAGPLGKLLGHKDDSVRANAAVSLEYIGCKASVAVLTKRAPREKNEAVANHMFRALGHCGAGEKKVRSTLAKNVTGAKSEFASYGPIIGLAYFGKDEKTAREVEKLIKKVGMPTTGRGAWTGAGRRALLGWCLAEVGFGDSKSAKFINEDVLPAIGESRWSGRIREYYVAIRNACNGDEEAKGAVQAGARRALSSGGGGGGGRRGRGGGGGGGQTRTLMDEARLDRGHVNFTPKGEFGPVGG